MINTLKDDRNKRFLPSKILGFVLTLGAAAAMVIYLRDAWAREQGVIGSGELIWLIAALGGLGGGLWAGKVTRLYELVLSRLGKDGSKR